MIRTSGRDRAGIDVWQLRLLQISVDARPSGMTVALDAHAHPHFPRDHLSLRHAAHRRDPDAAAHPAQSRRPVCGRTGASTCRRIAGSHQHEDAFGNITHCLHRRRPVHRTYRSRSKARSRPRTPTAWCAARSSAFRRACSCARPRSRSPTPRSPTSRRRARAGAGSDPLALLHALLTGCNREITFDTDPTHAATTAAEAFALQARRLPGPHPHLHRGGAPARHSGALCRRPFPPRRRRHRAGRRPRLGRGLCRDLGWVGFDPGQRHLRDRRPCAGRGRARLSRRRAGARHPLWRRRRNAARSRSMSTRRASRRRIERLRTLPAMTPRRYNLAAGSQKKKSDAMTYCCGILVRDGLVMIADTRTNAGLDNISTFRKLHVFTRAGRTHHGDRLLRQSVAQPVGALAR